MKPGIYDKNNKLLRELTEEDIIKYFSFNDLCEIEGITEDNLTVVLPEWDDDKLNFLMRDTMKWLDECLSIRKVDMSSCLGIPYCEHCKNLEEAILPDCSSSVLTAFADCSNMKNVYVTDDNDTFASENGVLYDIDKTRLIYYPAKNDSEINGNIESISPYAFRGYQKSMLKIPYGVKYLDDHALTFDNHQALTVILPDTLENVDPFIVIRGSAPITVYCSDRLREILKDKEKYSNYIKIKSLTLDVLLNEDLSLSMTEVNDYIKTDLER